MATQVNAVKLHCQIGCSEPRDLATEAGLLAVDQVEASVLLVHECLVGVGHDPEVEKSEVA